MSFPKELDTLIRGGGELSLILACILAEKKEKVLLVDERITLQKSAAVRISFFEKRFLQALGKKYNIDILVNIERWLTTLNIASFIDGRILSLNAGPLSNTQEFKRKFPLVSIPDFLPAFENTFFEISESFINCWEKEQNEKNVFQLFLKENKNKLSWAKEMGDEFRRLLPAIDFCLKNPFDPKTESELCSISTALTLLGPHYSYDCLELSRNLLAELELKGGFYKKTSIEEVKNLKQTSIVELESFEGLVYPKKILTEDFLLSPPIKKNGKVFTLWEIPIEFEIPLPWDQIILPQRDLQGGHILYAELVRTADEGWMWQAYFAQPHLGIDSHIAVFLEKTLNESLKVLPFDGKFKKLGCFKRKTEDFILYEGLKAKSWEDKRGLFSSLLRLRDVIMSS